MAKIARYLPGWCNKMADCVDEWRKERGFDEEMVSTLNMLNVEYVYV